MFELDAQIDKYTNDLRQKRSQNNHIHPPNPRLNGVALPTEEQNFDDIDYSNFASLPKQTNKTSKTDSNSTGAPVTSGSFRGRGRNARKLEPLLEVEEEISDGHASSKSSTEDLTQGPGPPRASRVTALKSRFEAEGANEGVKRWTSHNTESRVNKDVKFANGSSTPARRISPEGVETPSPTPEMLDLETVHSVAKERGKRSHSVNEFVDISSLRIKSPGQDVKNMETRNATVQEDAFEVPPFLQINNILGELDSKSEEPSCSTQCSTPSDGGDFSGPSSPSSLSSSSSVSSNSTSPKTAVFAITGIAKSNSFPRLTEPPPQQITETGSRASSIREGLQGHKTAQHQHALQRPSTTTKDLEPLNSKPERPNSSVLTGERSAEDFPLQTGLVKSEAIPTKNETVGSVARATVLDNLSRTGTKPKRFGETSTKQNEVSHGQNAIRLSEMKALDSKPEQISGTAAKASDKSSISDGKQVFNVAGIRATDSSVKTEKVQLSRLRFPTPATLNNGTSQQEDMFNSESLTRLDRKVEDPAPNTNNRERLEDTKKPVDSPIKASKRFFTNAPLPWFARNSNRTNNFKSSSGVSESNLDGKPEQALNSDETDNAKSLPNENIAGKATVNSPLIFKPISFRAKKLASEQISPNPSQNRSQAASPISNSISIRGESSSLTKITVTPSASYYSGRNSANILEKRSPVPTSKRQRFFHQDMAPTYPEVKELLANNEPSNDSSLDKQHEEFVDKENLDKGTLANREQENKTRKTPRSDAKQVVSSFNIQLSSQSRKQTEEQKATSPSSEDRNISHTSEEKRLNDKTESSRVSSESSRLYYDGGRIGSDCGRLLYENGEIVGGGDSEKSQRRREVLSKNAVTSSLLKPLSPSKQLSALQKTEETFRLKNAAQNSTGSSDDELPPKSGLSPTGTRPANNDTMRSERTPPNDHLQQNIVTKEIITMKSFPLKVADVDTGIPVALNENIGLTRQSHNPISDQSSIAIKNAPVTATSADNAKPVLANGNMASGESAEVVKAPAQNDRRKKARHVSLDPHAVLLDAAVEGELDLVKRVIREVRNFKIAFWKSRF